MSRFPARAAILLVLPLIFSACRKNDGGHAEAGDGYTRVNMTRASSDVLLPTKLWTDIEHVFQAGILEKEAHADTEGTKTKLDVPKDFFGFRILLKEKNQGVLGGENYQLDFGRGGGTLDLKDYVKANKGTFFMSVTPDIELKKEKLTVFFLSRTKKRVLGREEFGSGCDVYMDVSTHFNKSMKDGGIPVNITDLRYVNLLGGTFFFAVSIDGKLLISQLTVQDSRHREWNCPVPSEAGDS